MAIVALFPYMISTEDSFNARDLSSNKFGSDSATADFWKRKLFRSIQIVTNTEHIYCVVVPRSRFNPEAFKMPELNDVECYGPN